MGFDVSLPFTITDNYGKAHKRFRFVGMNAIPRGPYILVFRERRSDAPSGVSTYVRAGRYPTVSVPWLKWSTAYRFRRFGMLKVWTFVHRVEIRLFGFAR